MDVSQIKAGSLIEARFNDGPNRPGVVTELMHVKGVMTEGKLFGIRGLFYVAEFDAYWEIAIESSQVVFVAPVQLDFAALIATAKENTN